jgi:hypothetical protein
MSAKPVTIKDQAGAVERAAVNLRGHILTLRKLVDKGARPQTELDIAERFYRDLRAAADTFSKSAAALAQIEAMTADL